MDEKRQRILDDLSEQLEGEIRCDALTSSLYATDASLYQIPPLGVAFPRNKNDVVKLARYASEAKLPLIARGAGTGIAGEAIGRGLIVDFSRFMNSIVSIDEKTVRVQPGIVRDQLNRELKKIGRYFPPDPSNSAITTVGGMLGVDAAGSRSIRVGSTRDHVRSLEAVLANGQLMELSSELVKPFGDRKNSPAENQSSHERNSKERLVNRIARLLNDSSELIDEKQPRLVRNCSGYFLRGVLNGNQLNMPRMLVGSEGTLALFTEMTLHTSPLPEYRGVVIVLFGELEAATRTVAVIAGQQPSACDLLDRRLLSLAREADSRFAEMISPAAEAALIVEHTGFSDRDVRDRIHKAIEAVRKVNLRAIVAQEAYSPEDVDFLWSLPSKVVPLLTRLKGTTRPQPFVEDIAVPPEMLNEFLVAAQRVFQKYRVTSSLYAHAAAGQLHLRPFLPAPTPSDGQLLESIARDLYQEVFAVGGTISGEHGDGLSRTSFLRSQYGPLYPVFREIKNLFDPEGILNPGKIISDDPHLTVQNIRPPTQPMPETVELNLRWSADELKESLDRCNSCGICRTQSPESRMCPFFREEQSEERSPRAKVNAMRSLSSGGMNPREISSDAMKALADFCFNCKQCQLECPSNVNIPQMMIEAKAAHVSAHGMSRTDWVLSRVQSFGAIGSTISLGANWAIGNPYARWWLEKLFGIERRRKLPRFARRSFLRSMDRACQKKPTPALRDSTVVYFVGEYANYFDTELAHAVVAILRHHGIRVYVPPGQTGSGMSLVTAGDLETARDVAEKNVRELAELARDGFPILCSEPSAMVCLKQEYPMLLDDPDAEMIASRVMDVGDFLLERISAEKESDSLQELNLTVGYHTPCHRRALGKSTTMPELLALIPGLKVHTINAGCSGMAGTFGLSRENFPTSLQIGRNLIYRLRQGDLDLGSTECSSCKMQMEQGAPLATIHPLKLLAFSYGLMPGIAKKLKPSRNRLLLT
ncbi:MAG: FAD-binding and (Fe-S)-binding domain-containing protein [Planctomycetaceae bacterium]